MAKNITNIWEYPNMDPNQDVGLADLVKAMPALYGPNFDSAHFTPLFDNIRTAAMMSKPHHCTYKDSKGHDPNNLLVKNLIAGKLGSISWGQLNDLERVTESDGPQEHTVDETKQAILAQHEADMEELDTFGVLPEVKHTAYSVHIAFNENRIQRERTAAEEHRRRAAERKSTATGKSAIAGKLKKVASNIKEAVTSEHTDTKLTEAENNRLMESSYVKSGAKKSNRPDPSVFRNKRGGKNISDSPS